MTTELKKMIFVTEKVREYDENVKNILAHKIVLAHILAGTVDEFKGMEPEEIVPFIEGEPEVGTVPVEPGLTNSSTKIQGNNAEDAVVNEGTITFDVRFYVRFPDKRAEKNRKQKNKKQQCKEKQNRDDPNSARRYVKLLIDVEAQKDFYPGYDLVVRGIYYAARQLSAQKGVEFHRKYPPKQETKSNRNVKNVVNSGIACKNHHRSTGAYISYPPGRAGERRIWRYV